MKSPNLIRNTKPTTGNRCQGLQLLTMNIQTAGRRFYLHQDSNKTKKNKRHTTMSETMDTNKKCNKRYIKSTYTVEKENNHHGDLMTATKQTKIIRMYQQNIRGAKLYNSWEKWQEGTRWLNKNQVDIAFLVETNTAWTTNNIAAAKNKAKRESHRVLFEGSSCNELKETDYQPGGAACLVLNNITGYKKETIIDNKGLGRWCGFKLNGINKTNIVILSAYRPTASTDVCDNTCYSQQWRLMRKITDAEPNPRETFMTDLKKMVKSWERDKCEIIIGVDMNEAINTRNSKVDQLINSTTLVSLVETDNAPATYNRGKNCIDFILGTPNLKKRVISNGYLPFYGGGWESDHRGLFVDIDIHQMINNNNKDNGYVGRNLDSNNWMQANKFMKKLSLETLKTLTSKMKAIIDLSVLNNHQLNNLEQIDIDFTKILIESETKCKSSSTHWSDTLRHARQINKYWRIQLKGKINNIKVRRILEDIKANIPDETQVWQGDINRSPKKQLRKSIATVNQIKKDAWEHRKTFLYNLHHRYKEKGEEQKSEAVHKIQKAEFRLQCQRVCKRVNKPRGDSGGLTHILIEGEHGEEIIDNSDEIEKALIKRNIKHFSQAHNTPCASGDLQKLLGKEGLTETTKDALRGVVNKNKMSQDSEDMLKQLKQVRSTLSEKIPYNDMISGFLNWREKTVTSPSGKHLGIYRALIKCQNGKYDNTKTHQSTEIG
jgi:hypothetical protein